MSNHSSPDSLYSALFIPTTTSTNEPRSQEDIPVVILLWLCWYYVTDYVRSMPKSTESIRTNPTRYMIRGRSPPCHLMMWSSVTIKSRNRLSRFQISIDSLCCPPLVFYNAVGVSRDPLDIHNPGARKYRYVSVDDVARPTWSVFSWPSTNTRASRAHHLIIIPFLRSTIHEVILVEEIYLSNENLNPLAITTSPFSYSYFWVA